jgi:hypothetical protein
MFTVHARWLIYLANGIIDAALGLIVLTMYFRSKSWGGGVGA